MILEQYGWNEKQIEERKTYPQDYIEGRVISNHARIYDVMTEEGLVKAEVSGRFSYTATANGDYPAVGDYVLMLQIDDAYVIEKVMNRFSKFSRKSAGFTTDEQIVASNFDYVFIVMALNKDYNLRKLERYLVVAWESGAVPVIILSKEDLCDDVTGKRLEVEAISPGVDIFSISSLQHTGIEPLWTYLKPGKTVVVLGSSGVGKSTLVNTLAGQEILKVNHVREDDDKGRHTTTHREIVLLENGGIILDTPGMRELQLWQGDEGLDAVFAEISHLSKNCRFGDCTHTNEPGCAVIEAIESGELESERFDSYMKLKKEARFIERRQAHRERMMNKRQYDTKKPVRKKQYSVADSY